MCTTYWPSYLPDWGGKKALSRDDDRRKMIPRTMSFSRVSPWMGIEVNDELIRIGFT
jgi:hypothetical protein